MSGNLITDGLGGTLAVMAPEARITFFETLIANLEAAYLALSTQKVRSYTVNTGQTTQTVTKRELGQLSAALEWAYDRYEFFLSRANGGNTIIVR